MNERDEQFKLLADYIEEADGLFLWQETFILAIYTADSRWKKVLTVPND